MGLKCDRYVIAGRPAAGPADVDIIILRAPASYFRMTKILPLYDCALAQFGVK
jgi:hypothetical protein